MGSPLPPRHRRDIAWPIAAGLFAIGLLAVVAILLLSLAGLRDLPVWLNAVGGVLPPIALAIAVGSTVHHGGHDTRRLR